MPNLIPLKFAKKENICKAQSAKLSRNLEVLRLSIEGNEHNWTLREILRFPAAHPGLQKIAQLYVRSVLLKSLRPFFTCTKCFLHTLLSSNTWIIGATVYGIIINQLPDYPEHPRTLDLLCRQEGYNNLYDYLLVEGYMVTEEYEKRVSSHTLDARVFVFEKCVEGYSGASRRLMMFHTQFISIH
jgi:hypothetical protein